MTIQHQILNEISKLNANIQNMMTVLSPAKNLKEWVYIKEAETILNRKRTWVKARMIKATEVDIQSINTNAYLVQGVDWKRDGKLLIFKFSSLERLKNEMLKA